MIIANIYGGLGNQLFQYAAGRALAHYHNVPLKLDTSFYANQKHRDFALSSFNAECVIASPEEITQVRKNGFLSKAYEKLLPTYKRSLLMEPHYHYYEKFFEGRPHSYISGLWQSEKYFSSIKEVIRQEFALKTEIISTLKERAEAMRNEMSVSVHIRRGDYLLTKAISALPKDYYERALSFVLQKSGGAKVYIFSDGIDWVKENLVLNSPHEFISGFLTKNSYEDFYLMQQCSHNIIANSTFSWWSAWLNKNDDKIVVAPKTWFNRADSNTNDLILDHWYRV